MAKIISIVFLGFGFFILFQVASPIIGYQLLELRFSKASDFLASPQNERDQILGVSVQNDLNNFPAFVSNIKRAATPPFDSFELSIPKLGVLDALVFVDSNDLKSGLTHLPGSALPGERGNMFISGHSALPQFFNGNKNYGSIFANLTKLGKGDEIKIKVLGSEFSYRVSDIKIVSPNDLSVIYPPNDSGRFISLMTCVPPGLNTKRLVVVGKSI